MSRRLAVVLVSGFVASCSGTEGVQGPSSAFESPAAAGAPATPREDLERDLVLRLRRATTEPFETGRDPKFEVVLANRSTTRSYPVVLPSDGSEPGWREPHAFYTVERRPSASEPWTVAKLRPFGRCGIYDEDWAKDVTTLEPGREIVLPWFSYYDVWDLDDASHVKIVAHYVYGDHARDLRKVPPALHGMPAYALSSNALELAIEPPLVLELSLKGPLPAEGAPLDRSFEVIAHNRSAAALPFGAADTGAVLRIEIEGDDGQIYEVVSGFGTSYATDHIAAGARRSVVGSAKAESVSLALTGVRPRRARALMTMEWRLDGSEESSSRVARSPWMTVNPPR